MRFLQRDARASPAANQKPPRSATTKPPPARSAKQPIASGIGIAVFRPLAGSKRLRAGASMSTQ